MSWKSSKEGARRRPGALLLVRVGAFALTVALLAAGCSSDDKSASTQQEQTNPAVQRTACPGTPGKGAAIAIQRLFPATQWRLDRENQAIAHGCVRLDGKPVAGALVSVEDYEIPDPTGKEGGFDYPLDTTIPARYRVRVTNVSAAKVDGEPATEEQKRLLRHAESSVAVYFRLSDVKATPRPGGQIAVSGQATFADGTAPPAVVLYSYRLSGSVRKADGSPLAGAVVSTRSVDRELWTLSPRTDSHGHYDSIFYPSGDADPVGFTVRVAVGDDVYNLRNNELVFFRKLKSAQLSFRLPRKGALLAALPVPHTYKGAVYEGVLVGVAANGKPIRPVSARWIDKTGRFEFVLPASLRGKTVSFWESQLYAFSRTPAKPGAPVDLSDYPSKLAPDVPADLQTLRLPR